MYIIVIIPMEIIIMIIGLWAKPYFFHDDFGRFRFQGFIAFLLFVKELFVIDHFTNRRIGLW